MQRLVPALVALVWLLTPQAARAADLVVWWDKGYYEQEDEAVREIIAAFEQQTGKTVELALHPITELPGATLTALEAGRPPDFAFGFDIAFNLADWAFDDRLVDLSTTVGGAANMFDADALERATLADAKTGRKALYGLPIGRSMNHVHVWKSLLQEAGFTIADIPREWDAFWSFWCDDIQPAVRKATGRDDIWGVGLPMAETFDTQFEFFQFVAANGADYVTRGGRLVIDDPEIRQKLVSVVDSYTAVYDKGCTPPGSVDWRAIDNNQQFLAQRVVMTANETLSIPNALKRERPEDYYVNSATIEWPLGPGGEPFPITGMVYSAVVLKGAAHVATAEEFVRFLLTEGWLAHYLDFSSERLLPPMPKLRDAPFWLDPRDPHHMASVMQASARGLTHNYAAASGDRRHDRVDQELTWAKAIHQVAAERISPEQAVGEAIARIKQILAE